MSHKTPDTTDSTFMITSFSFLPDYMYISFALYFCSPLSLFKHDFRPGSSINSCSYRRLGCHGISDWAANIKN